MDSASTGDWSSVVGILQWFPWHFLPGLPFWEMYPVKWGRDRKSLHPSLRTVDLWHKKEEFLGCFYFHWGQTNAKQPQVQAAAQVTKPFLQHTLSFSMDFLEVFSCQSVSNYFDTFLGGILLLKESCMEGGEREWIERVRAGGWEVENLVENMGVKNIKVG